MSEIIKVEDFFSATDHKLAVRDIFAMYHHSWDVIGEGIQNAVDAVLKKAEEASSGYVPSVKMTYNARTKDILIEDNGNGIASDSVRAVAAPHFSMKNPLEANRGEFGIGLTLIAFSSNSFKLESVYKDRKAQLEIKNGYSWAMDENGQEELAISYDSQEVTNLQSYTKITAKPVRFPPYTLSQLEYILRRYTAIGDFWSCYKKEDGSVKFTLTYIDESGKKTDKEISNKMWHPADYLKAIGVETVDWKTVKSEVNKGKEYAMPNWIGFGLTDSDTITEEDKEFTYYALFCRTSYYKQLAQQVGLSFAEEETQEEEAASPEPKMETLDPGIFISKKGMPLGAIIDHPRTGQAGYWRSIFIIMNCDTVRTEPGRKKLHVDDEKIARSVARKIFYKLTGFSHYIIPRDPDEEIQSLLRNVDKTIQLVRQHKKDHPLFNPRNQIIIDVEPANEQSLIALFHELIGSKLLHGYKALRLSAAETYDGVYEYTVPKDEVGKEHWHEWLNTFPAKERKEIEKRGSYHLDEMIVEFKMNLEDIIGDFLQKTKYHSNIKLIIAWQAREDLIKRKGWLLEKLPSSKHKFSGAIWRLRPSAEGQTRGILATDVLLLKSFLAKEEQ